MIIFTQELTKELYEHLLELGLGIQHSVENGWVTIDPSKTDEEVNEAIENFKPHMPNLSPRQFKYLLLITDLEDNLQLILSQLKTVDIYLYADIKSQIDGGLTYFFDKTWTLLNNPIFKDALSQLKPELNLSENNVRNLWITAANHQPMA